MELYPAFEFRRREFLERHPWWGDLVGQHPRVTERLRQRIREEGPLRSVDMEGSSGGGWWNLKIAKRVATALWSSGELAIRERRNFQRSYDLAERVIPEEVRARPLSRDEGISTLLLRALTGHGWATTGTLASTWRLVNRRAEIAAALERLVERGEIVACALENPAGRPTAGWIRPADLELAARLDRVRPRRDRGVLLSPFDPVLWDRARVKRLFDFDQVLEIFKPAAKRQYGYYCMPVLAGERLVARYDFKADRRRGVLKVLSCHHEESAKRARPAAVEAAAQSALTRYATAIGLEPVGGEA